ncbi:MAG: Rne/Rng family ribonuclease [Hyphomicrobiaceae bacterium]
MAEQNKMLIDATHPEETRVVVLRGGRVEEFDYESAARKQLRGNIYLAKVTRVEPSLQAAFVDYGGNRHGFLAFNEIHPDYYQIPVADRLALIEEEAAAEAAEEAAAEARADARARREAARQAARSAARGAAGESASSSEADDEDDEDEAPDDEVDEIGGEGGDSSYAARDEAPDALAEDTGLADERRSAEAEPVGAADDTQTGAQEPAPDHPAADATDEPTSDDEPEPTTASSGEAEAVPASGNGQAAAEAEDVEQVGSEDALEELPSRPRRRMRHYKIQEVIKRRQVILVQVVKEERGNKGAALTTYLSLAGRYTVLMPNTARGGGISRKITQPQDRKRLKAIAAELDVPEGMGLIIRTAGAARTKQEIKRDFEYLLRLWESVRDLTLQSTAPSLVYEEGDLIKRSIRDLYNKDVDEIVVAGDAAFREAKDFMRMLMPSHAKNVLHYQQPEPLFTRFQIERQLNAMFSPYVTLKSGGYLVINQTEALVAIDVNSGKSTREFSIEETAHNTNLEAADEIARQLKLRDLAGLIVIDFIDMEEKRNNRSVERRLKDALRFDRARIQVGRISHFGLLEMSRQRLRTGVLEGSTSQCPHCQGTGIIRSVESVALAVLRGLEDAVMAGGRHALTAVTTSTVALYILNKKRTFINDMEARHGQVISVEGSDKMQGANFAIEKGPVQAVATRRPERTAVNMDWGFGDDEDEAPDTDDEGEAEAMVARDGDEPRERADRGGDRDGDDRDGGRRRRRRRRRGRRQDREMDGVGAEAGDDREPARAASGRDVDADDDEDDIGDDVRADESDDAGAEPSEPHAREEASGDDDAGDAQKRRRRRGRRGGRRNRDRLARDENGTGANDVTLDADEALAPPEAEDDDERDGSAYEPSPAASAPNREDATHHGDGADDSADQREPADDAPVALEADHDRTEPPAPPRMETVESPRDEAAEPPRAARGEPVSSAPRIERVVVTPNGDGGAQSDAHSEPDGGQSGSTRKGWWQRRLGL